MNVPPLSPPDLPNPLLSTHRRIFIRGLQLAVSIGIHDFERTAPQTIVFDIDVYVSKQNAHAAQDDIDAVVDYDFIRDIAIDTSQHQHFELQETLGDAIAQQILQHPQVAAVQLSTRKPDVYPDCDAVGIETFHSK